MSDRRGKIYLVGAGPGDPGLLTLAGAAALSRADVVVYDRLANSKLLDLAPDRAVRVFAGKGPKAHARSQEVINLLLVENARAGRTVVRLKGGDPFVFGRGGEEAEALREAGIPFEVVPGVTSAVAAPAYAGIPVTHRGVASSVAFVTGHEDPDKPERDVDWAKLATAVDTLVLLMGVSQLPEIIERLVGAGRERATPVAVIEWGTLPRQRVISGTLADIVQRTAEAKIEPPAIAVIGDVVNLRDTLRWFDTKPLFGLRVLVTRTREQASELARSLEEAGAEPIELPALKIVPRFDADRLSSVIEALARGDYAWVCFTSAHGVAIFFDALSTRKGDARAVRASVAAIGPATASALRRYGIAADLVPAQYTAEGLREAFGAHDVRDKRVLVPRAEGARELLVDDLSQRGARVDEVTLYTAEVPDAPDAEGLRRLHAGEIDVVTFASSSSVRNLIALLGGDARLLLACKIAAIGPVTAATVEELLGRPPDAVAREHTISGVVEALVFSRLAPSSAL
jgi:uroporphyrinogen III methyltransferase/synthase